MSCLVTGPPEQDSLSPMRLFPEPLPTALAPNLVTRQGPGTGVLQPHSRSPQGTFPWANKLMQRDTCGLASLPAYQAHPLPLALPALQRHYSKSFSLWRTAYFHIILYSFPVAAMMNYHDLSDLKPHPCIFPTGVAASVTGIKSRCRQGWFFLRTLGRS